MSRLSINNLSQWITAATVQHGQDDLAAHLVERLGVTRATANKALRRLVELSWLVREGSQREPHFCPGLLRQVVHQYSLAGLQEDLQWARDFAPYFDFPIEVQRMTQHAFCELLNNAIDHSEGSSVTVSLRQTPSHVQLLVSDNGRGLFDKLRELLALDDPHMAMLELSKGKLTSQPHRHRGHGLFFTSKLADVFDLHANGIAFQHRAWENGGWSQGRPHHRQGTSAYAAIALDTPRTLPLVLGAYSLNGSGLDFDRTTIPLRLLTSPLVGLESRAQARRVVARLNQFRRAELDFNDVAAIGLSFADELFRVCAQQQPGLELVPINMSSAITETLLSVAP